MKLQIIKEVNWMGDVWYSLYKDDAYMTGSPDLSVIEKYYKQALEDPENFFKSKKEILKSQEIDISLEKN